MTLTMMPGEARAADLPALPETGDARPDMRVSLVAADRNHDPRRVDDVAGSEFIDDRIRLGE